MVRDAPTTATRPTWTTGRWYLAAIALLVLAAFAAMTVAEVAKPDRRESWLTMLTILAVGVTTLYRLACAAVAQRLTPVVLGAFSLGFMTQFVIALAFFAAGLGGCDARVPWSGRTLESLWFVNLGALGVYLVTALVCGRRGVPPTSLAAHAFSSFRRGSGLPL